MAKDLHTLGGRELLGEMQRRALDLLIVHNPTDTPYTVIWNTNERHVVPPVSRDDGYGPGNQMVTRYIGEKYLTEMTDKQLTTFIDDSVKEENRKRVSEGKQEMSKYQGGEQFAFEGRIDNPDMRKKIMSKLFVRVEREYAGGYDEAVEERIDPAIARGTDSELIDEIMGAVYGSGEVEEVETE